MEEIGIKDIVFGGIASVAFVLAVVLVSYGKRWHMYMIFGALLKLAMCWYYCLGTELMDTVGYVESGHEYGEILRDFFLSGSTEYFVTTPFWSITGDATHRMFSLVAALLLGTGNSFMASSVAFAAMGYAGQLLLATTLIKGDSKAAGLWFATVLMLPSLTYWSSGMLKDSVGVLGLGVATVGLVAMLDGKRGKAVIGLAVGVYILYLFRTQVLFAFAGLALTAAVVRTLERSQASKRNVIIGTAAAIAAGFAAMRYGSITREADIVSSVGTHAAQFATAGYNDMELYDVKGSWFYMILWSPVSIFNVLFRPFLWECRNIPMYIAALENVLLEVTIVIMLFRRYDPTKRALMRPLLNAKVAGALCFVILMGCVVGFSTPNWGSANRYRIPMLPFLLFLLWYSGTADVDGKREGARAGRRRNARLSPPRSFYRTGEASG